MLKKAYQRPLGRGLEPRAPFRASNQSTSGLFRGFRGRLVDCNSGCVSTDAMLHVAVRPDKWLASRVVRPDVLQELAPQVRDGGEDPARKEIPLDLRKPELDLVEPRGVGRRVVDGDARMRCQPDLHAL